MTKTKKEKGSTFDGEDTFIDYIPKWVKEELKKKKGKLSRKEEKKKQKGRPGEKRQSPPFNPPFADNSGFLVVLTRPGLSFF